MERCVGQLGHEHATEDRMEGVLILDFEENESARAPRCGDGRVGDRELEGRVVRLCCACTGSQVGSTDDVQLLDLGYLRGHPGALGLVGGVLRHGPGS